MNTTTSTVVFTDVVSSSSIRAGMGEDAADTLFRSLQQALDLVVTDHCGHVVPTSGDGMMAAFGSATDAVRSAVAMQQRVTHHFPGLGLRVGVAAGDVSWDGDDRSALPIVTAAGLEARAEGGQILVSDLVRNLAGDRADVPFQPLGMVVLEGLAHQVSCFEAGWAGLDDDRGGFTVPCPAPVEAATTFPFVGRDAERHELSVRWAAARSGSRRTVLIGGEAGAGKTRLAFEFARQCATSGAAVLLGLCDTELALPYQPWVQVLDHLVRSMPADAVASLVDELAEVSLVVPQLERIVPGLRRAPSTDPETDRYRLFEAVDAILADAARRWPTVIVIDDLHWAGAQTLALLRHVTRSGTASRLLVIGTFRDTGDEITEPLAGCLADLRRTECTTRIHLVGLDEEGVRRFVAGAVGHELDDGLRELASSLAAHSSGNAFYLGELWRHVVASGVVARSAGRWTVRSPGRGIGVPDSVREVVTNRLGRLSRPAHRLVELMAAAGQEVELRVLTRATDLSEEELEAALDELVEDKTLTEVNGLVASYRFTHAIVRDTVELAMAPSNRARLHRRLGEAVESAYESDRRPVLARLARHFSASAARGQAAKAVYYGRRAGAQAIRAVAYDEAISHLQMALELSPTDSVERADILLDLGAAQSRQGFYGEAMETFTDAFRFARSLGLVAQAAQAAAGFESAVQMPGLPGGPAVDIVSEALSLLGPLDGPLRMVLQASLARAMTMAGRNDEARRTLEALLPEARRHGDAKVLIAALQSSVVSEVSLEPRRVLRDADELTVLAERHGDLDGQASAKGCQVRALLTLGEVDRARVELGAYEAVADRGRFVFHRYLAVVFEVMLAVIDGRFDDAERLAEQAHEFGETARSGSGSGVYGVHMYAIRREQGRLGEVAPVLRMAATLQHDQGVWRPGLAALLAEAGMLEEAGREYGRLAPDGFAAVPRDAMWPACLTFLAEVCVALGDRDGAATLYRELEPFRGLNMMVGFTICLGPAERLMGLLAAASGRRVDAERHFAAALDLAERSGSPPWRARVQADWATALGDRPDLLAAASVTARSIGMAGLADRTERPAGNGRTAAPNGLSAREVEVLRLVGGGLSNRAIGERLHISPNTAANHVRSILQKTASANRAEATAYAARHGLLQPLSPSV